MPTHALPISLRGNLSQSTKISLPRSENSALTSAARTAIIALSLVSSNAAAVAIMKISNDLRWMNSGPLAGLIELQAGRVHRSCLVK